MNNVKAIQRITETELTQGRGKKSWHDMYAGSAYVFIGGLNYSLTEGDVLAVFSQYGEIMNINMVRDKKTGKAKGFCFLCYENQKSTVLAVDNMNGIKLCGKTIRVDHVAEYRRPKDEDGNEIVEKGCAPKTPTPSPEPSESESEDEPVKIKKKKTKKFKDKKKKKRKEKIGMSDNEGEGHTTKKQSRREMADPEARKASGDNEKSRERTMEEEHRQVPVNDKSGRSRGRRERGDEYPSRHNKKKSYRDRSRSRSRDRKEQYKKNS
ncbi:RNA-binding motif protein, X-linked 2-like [Halichondria panicea]|uniref:RNA-binding motif protein, X-linked 2-like n=1 Tax=Halichondria panicea TaxID=6063 RepID=UPI00312B865A